MGKPREYGLNGAYFNDAREFYSFFGKALKTHNIDATLSPVHVVTDGDCMAGTRATGVKMAYDSQGKPALELKVVLYRSRIDQMDFFTDFRFDTALVRNVGDVNQEALERTLAAVHEEQAKRAKRFTSKAAR